jgi:AcrR family transcriptional regulator
VSAEATSLRVREQRTALSDARMTDAAVALICERGAAATTLKDVGMRAGYSRGLANYRFGTKQGLWAVLVRTIGEEWRGQLAGAVHGTTGLATIHAAVDAHARFLVDSPDRIRAFYTLWFDSVGPDDDLKAVIANIHERRRTDVAGWIRRGVMDGSIRSDAHVAAVSDQFCAAIIGIVYQWLVTPPEAARVHELHAGLKDHMTRLLAAEGERSQEESSP